ncbi:SusD/RagB family nutrient-binding outer membrane lipoprotein [Mucilaginibacter limnophilus]|uniref:SusD/RagB family nutrient-binding outer membrane lipoprotein n=1 Tax=Mucilaginibacter limnophilus TaxID=1932778 RepID=A0A3S2V868_9SPHI|nr:SusD/RagB family nutrient-binding outer membrane lipoprotein [Mucilaginibacter limnophilus]RVU00965.1 SusD/RagB family nutrient-binding outer membrane lipoprotein [Mucilaginibacter limnophilus]
MKTKFIKHITLLSATLLLGAGCTKDFVERNTNPNSYNQTNFDPNYMLTSAELAYTGSTDFAYETWRGNLIYCSTFMQGFSSVVSYWAGDKYLLNEGYTAAYWEKSYSEQVKPIVDIIEWTKDKPQYKNLTQIARIVRALIFQRLTDLYGDVPYSEAGLGYYEKVFYPKYDKQEAIYADLLKEVSEATDALDAGGDRPAGDAIYQGNIDKWKRFGYTLQLRIAMRLTKVDPETAKSYATKVAGKTLTIEDDAFLKHDGSGGRTTNNRNSQVLLGDGGQENFYVKWSNTFINNLKSNNDPRLSVLACTKLYDDENDKTQNANPNFSAAAQKGMPNGLDFSTPGHIVTADPSFTSFPDYSSPSPYLTKRDGPTFILTYAESELLLADAAERFGLGDAATHYNNGVKAAITYLKQYDAGATISDNAAQAYVNAHPYAGLEQTNVQYWILTCSMLDFYEAWANYRRTGYPDLDPVNFPNNATSGTIPRRFPYPSAEAVNNPDNYGPAHGSVPGGDLLTGRVWWDKQ